jgi:hydroxyacylglutathione hydrolase
VDKLIEYRDHRRQRVQQVLDALAARGPSTPDELAAAVYTEVPARMLPMAARNVRANLEMLAAHGQVVDAAHGRWALKTST